MVPQLFSRLRGVVRGSHYFQIRGRSGRQTERRGVISGRSNGDWSKHCFATPLKLTFPNLVNGFKAVWSDLFWGVYSQLPKERLFNVKDLFRLPWLFSIGILYNCEFFWQYNRLLLLGMLGVHPRFLVGFVLLDL